MNINGRIWLKGFYEDTYSEFVEVKMKLLNTKNIVWTLTILTSFGIGYKLYSDSLEDSQPEPIKSFNKLKNNERIVRYVSKTYKVPENITRAIVSTVHVKTAQDTFPDASMVLAVIATESSFKTDARSHAGARGLMQVMAVHGRPKSFVDNIALGIKVLKSYRKQVGTDDEALMAYNIGITRFKQGGSNIQYVKRVKHHYEMFNNLMTV